LLYGGNMALITFNEIARPFRSKMLFQQVSRNSQSLGTFRLAVPAVGTSRCQAHSLLYTKSTTLDLAEIIFPPIAKLRSAHVERLEQAALAVATKGKSPTK
jgi:hypothetical protein